MTAFCPPFPIHFLGLCPWGRTEATSSVLSCQGVPTPHGPTESPAGRKVHTLHSVSVDPCAALCCGLAGAAEPAGERVHVLGPGVGSPRESKTEPEEANAS